MFKIGLVIPCYNEAHRLAVDEYAEFAAMHPHTELLFVNDGSTDGTGAMLDELVGRGRGDMDVYHLPQNRGKSEAVRQGVLQLLQDPAIEAVGYWDADLATPLDELPRFIGLLQQRASLHLIMGTRLLRLGADIRRSPMRHYTGRVFATAASVILGLPVYDTQCGAKLLRRPLAEALFGEPFTSRWLFDVELLARMIGQLGRQGTRQAAWEVPLTRWIDPGQSKVRLRDFLRAPFELLRIRRRYREALRRP